MSPDGELASSVFQSSVESDDYHPEESDDYIVDELDLSASSSSLSSSSSCENNRISKSPSSLLEYMAGQTIPCPDKEWEEYRKYLKWLHPRVKAVKNWPKFSKVFLISALESDGTEDLKDYLKEISLPGTRMAEWGCVVF